MGLQRAGHDWDTFTFIGLFTRSVISFTLGRKTCSHNFGVLRSWFGPLGQCFSKFKVHRSRLETLLRCKFWFTGQLWPAQVCSVVSDSLQYGLEITMLLCPWNFPGENTGLGCHFLLQGIFLTQGLNLCLLRLCALAGTFFFFFNH